MGISGRIARYFQQSALTPLLALILFLMGVFAAMITPREEEPQIDVTMANVFVPFPGASARDVETLVSTPAEQVFSRVKGVEHVYSVSRPGMSVITVQYEVGVPNQEAVLRLLETVHSYRDWVRPELGVQEPVVKPKGIDDVPIVSLTFSRPGEDSDGLDLLQVAQAVEVELKRIPGTRDVSTIGGPQRVIRVAMDVGRMNSHGVTALDLRNALRAANGKMDSGALLNDGREVRIETGYEFETAADVRALVVAARDRKPVTVGDVAKVEDTAETATRYVRHGNRAGETVAVTLQISKKPGVNAADVAKAAVARVESLKGTVIPEGVEVTTTRNYGATATEKASKLIGKLVFATAAVVLLVLLALGRREAVIVGVAVTLTLAATLFASWAWGFTLNRVSLFALIFSIGILVDDAIVVVENIHRWQALYPEKKLVDLIPGAVDEVGGPTILATFTVIAALLPMAFVSGLMGPYMSPIPINSSLGMFISLAVAFIVTPWLALKLMGQHGAGGHQKSKLDRALEAAFTRLLTPFLDARRGARLRAALWAGVVALIVGSVALAVVKLVVLKMLPFDNKSEFQVVLDMPAGTPVEETARVLGELAAVVSEIRELESYQTYAGTASPINFNGLVRQYYLRSAPEHGDIQVNLVDKAQRSRQSHEIAGSVRDKIAAVGKANGGNAKVVEVPPGPPVMSPLVAEVYGPEYGAQIEMARLVRKAFEATPDIVGVDDSIEADAKKTVLNVRQSKAAQLGVVSRDVADTMRIGLAGEDVTPLKNAGGKFEVPVRLMLPPTSAGKIDALLALRVRPHQGGNAVPASELVKADAELREKAIYHKDLLPVVFFRDSALSDLQCRPQFAGNHKSADQFSA